MSLSGNYKYSLTGPKLNEVEGVLEFLSQIFNASAKIPR